LRNNSTDYSGSGNNLNIIMNRYNLTFGPLSSWRINNNKNNNFEMKKKYNLNIRRTTKMYEPTIGERIDYELFYKRQFNNQL